MMKAYPEYTDSLIEGIDKIPSNWNVMRFRHLFSIGRGLGITKENLQDDGIPCVNYGEIHSKYGFELDLEKHPLKCVHEGYLESSPSSLLNKGDLVYADTSEDLEGSGNFTQLVSDEKTFAGYHTVIARQTRNHDDRFLAYALDSDYCRNQIRRMVKGVKVFSITQTILKDTSILLPSYDEQRSISSFLDVNTSRIDNLIAEKETFIKLLSEKRQALIIHVVTKGLNPNVPMKDSGVEWIGEIPESWDVKRFRHLFSLGKGLTITKEHLRDRGIPCVNYGEIHSKYNFELDIERHPLKYVDEAYLDTDPSSLISAGDFVFADTSEDFDGCGNFTHLLNDAQVFAGYHTIIGRLERNHNSRYISYFLDSNEWRNQIRKMVKGVKVFSISQKILKDTVLFLPCEDEQNRAVEYLDRKIRLMKELEQETTDSIKLLQEHRVALISAAVTGKIDVREEV